MTSIHLPPGQLDWDVDRQPPRLPLAVLDNLRLPAGRGAAVRFSAITLRAAAVAATGVAPCPASVDTHRCQLDEPALLELASNGADELAADAEAAAIDRSERDGLRCSSCSTSARLASRDKCRRAT